MPFTEICIYRVKPQKVEEFEALMQETQSFFEKQEGLHWKSIEECLIMPHDKYLGERLF